MSTLWRAIVTDDPAAARRAFFPLAAYLQVKALPDPAADWHERLFTGFALDVGAAHQLLGPGAAGAMLVQVNIPSAQARWIRPGTCANRVGYWHIAGARLVYRSAGSVRSFGVASMISWRGTWYVVHLGAVAHPSATGVVDRPASGPGIPGPPGGC